MNRAACSINATAFGVLPDGRSVEVVSIANHQGMKVEILNYGGILRRVEVPDEVGAPRNVVLGFGTLEQYIAKNPYFGAIIGRFANRIGYGRFDLDGYSYNLSVNDFPHTMHGGAVGFDKRLWEYQLLSDDASQSVRLRYRSPHGEEGFPGSLDAEVTYRLLNTDNVLEIDYQAQTDQPTVVNLTNHSYFNLSGEGSGSIEAHLLEINADYYLPLNSALLPTGEHLPVRGTAMDFASPRAIGERLRDGTTQLVLGNGYDHNYLINREVSGIGLAFAARVEDPSSGITLEVWTTEPGLDFYSGNFLDGSLIGSSGRAYRQGDAFALEPEHFADSPNRIEFPSTVLRPGETYVSNTQLRFGTT